MSGVMDLVRRVFRWTPRPRQEVEVHDASPSAVQPTAPELPISAMSAEPAPATPAAVAESAVQDTAPPAMPEASVEIVDVVEATESDPIPVQPEPVSASTGPADASEPAAQEVIVVAAEQDLVVEEPVAETVAPTPTLSDESMATTTPAAPVPDSTAGEMPEPPPHGDSPVQHLGQE